jgi:hypothetical protein
MDFRTVVEWLEWKSCLILYHRASNQQTYVSLKSILLLKLRSFIPIPIISDLVDLSCAKPSIILSCCGFEQAPTLFESPPVARGLFEPWSSWMSSFQVL